MFLFCVDAAISVCSALRCALQLLPNLPNLKKFHEQQKPKRGEKNKNSFECLSFGLSSRKFNFEGIEMKLASGSVCGFDWFRLWNVEIWAILSSVWFWLVFMEKHDKTFGGVQLL